VKNRSIYKKHNLEFHELVNFNDGLPNVQEYMLATS